MTEQLKDLLKALGFRSMGDTVKPIFQLVQRTVSKRNRRELEESVVLLGSGWARWDRKWDDRQVFSNNVRVTALKKILERRA